MRYLDKAGSLRHGKRQLSANAKAIENDTARVVRSSLGRHRKNRPLRNLTVANGRPMTPAGSVQ
jgi:hypothetical protein